MREAFLTIHDRFFNHKLQRIVARSDSSRK